MRTVGYYMGERVQALGEPAVEALLAVVNDGLADEQDGDVDSYGGHLARVADRLLLTDSDGNRHACLVLPPPLTLATGVMTAHLIVAKHRLHRETAETQASCSRPSCDGKPQHPIHTYDGDGSEVE